MVFHEITKPAILAAAENPRELDMDLVEAQEARRILDRLYGYEVTPGAVEEGHVRPVRRPRAVGRDPPGGRPRAGADGVPGRVLLGPRGHVRRRQRPRASGCSRPGCTRVDERRVARGARLRPRRRADRARPARPDVVHLDRGRAEALAAGLRDTAYDVRSVESKPYRRSPYAPFRTTTLQQEASRKLGMSASVTMSVAQRLYENGYITYMRTDSTTLRAARPSTRRGRRSASCTARDYLPD